MVATFTVDSRGAGTEVGRPVRLLQRDGGGSEVVRSGQTGVRCKADINVNDVQVTPVRRYSQKGPV